ncbi:myb-like protein P [Stomoxys calcitrans]|uniref:myb-like protein P n=1 Tax=Stomoxys calcitrans TaxID=35570 RepID=UPI0027E33BC6|nr:myb-like protein P [Stomoxys calcitrans]
MKCVTSSRNLSLTNKVTKNKNRSNSHATNSLLTNAANMKITKAIVNSKQINKNKQKGLATATASASGNLAAFSYPKQDSASCSTAAMQDLANVKESANLVGQGKKESFNPTTQNAPARNSLSGLLTATTNTATVQKETDYHTKEQRSPTILGQSITHNPTITTNATAEFQCSAGTQQTREPNNTPLSNSSVNYQQQQQQAQAQASNNNTTTNCNEFLRSAMNLNLSSLAAKTPQLISVVNEQSNQTVINITATNTNTNANAKTTTTTTPPTTKQNEDNENIILAKANNSKSHEVTTTATTINNKTTITAATTITANLDHQQTQGKADHYQTPPLLLPPQPPPPPQQQTPQIKSLENSLKRNVESSTTTTTTKSLINQSANINNHNKSVEPNISDNNENNKTVINSHDNLTLQTSDQTQHSHQPPTETNTPQNYRGLNNSVIIANFNNSSQAQTSGLAAFTQNSSIATNTNAIANSLYNQNSFVASGDPNLNLAVIGNNSEHQQQQQHQASPHSQVQLQVPPQEQQQTAAQHHSPHLTQHQQHQLAFILV